MSVSRVYDDIGGMPYIKLFGLTPELNSLICGTAFPITYIYIYQLQTYKNCPALLAHPVHINTENAGIAKSTYFHNAYKQ